MHIVERNQNVSLIRTPAVVFPFYFCLYTEQTNLFPLTTSSCLNFVAGSDNAGDGDPTGGMYHSISICVLQLLLK